MFGCRPSNPCYRLLSDQSKTNEGQHFMAGLIGSGGGDSRKPLLCAAQRAPIAASVPIPISMLDLKTLPQNWRPACGCGRVFLRRNAEELGAAHMPNMLLTQARKENAGWFESILTQRMVPHASKAWHAAHIQVMHKPHEESGTRRYES